MITVKIKGHNVNVDFDKLGRWQTVELMETGLKGDVMAFKKLLSRLIEGGANTITAILDPVDKDPTYDEMKDFLNDAIDKAADIKNSLGSQNSSESASQPSAPTSSDTTESTSMMFEPIE